MFKAVIDVYVYIYIYKSEFKYLWSKEINVKDFPALPTITYYEYQFLFSWHVLHIVKYASVRGVSVAVNEIFVHMDTHLSSRWICASANARIPWFTDFKPAKT